MTRVFIVALTPTVRAGLRALLAPSDIQVVGEASSFLRPSVDLSSTDVIVVADEALLQESLRGIIPAGTVGIVVFSNESRSAATLRSLPLLGWGIVSREATPSELQATILAVTQGMIVFSLPLAEALLSQRSTAETQAEPLTTREHEVLDLLSQGLSNKLIARTLQISEHTVKFHISSIYTKLGASSRTDAVSRGARRGLITL